MQIHPTAPRLLCVIVISKNYNKLNFQPIIKNSCTIIRDQPCLLRVHVSKFVRFQVLTAVKMPIVVFCVVMPYGLTADYYQRFGGTFRLQFQ
jgi:hypothetical protein